MSSLDNQIGVAEESVFGTYVAPTRFPEFTAEGLSLDKPWIASSGQRPGDRLIRSDHRMRGKRQAAGDLEFEFAGKGFGLWLKHALGTVTTVADGAGKKHTFVLGSLTGKSLTVQKGLSSVDAAGADVIEPFSYTGGKITQLSLTQEVEAFLMLGVSLDFADEVTSQALAAFSAPTLAELFGWDDLVVTVGGVATDVKAASVTIANNFNTDRFFLGKATKKEPRENAKRDITGSITPELESLVQYAHFQAGDVVPIVMTWTGQTTYDTAKPYKLVVTMAACEYDGETPTHDAQEIVEQPLPFTVTNDGTNPGIQIDLYTSDVTP